MSHKYLFHAFSGTNALFFAVFPRGQAKVRLECPVEIGEVLEPAAGSDAQHRVIRCVQGFGSGIEPVFLEKSNELFF